MGANSSYHPQLERAFENPSPEERRQERQKLAKPVLEEFFRWGSTRKAAPKSKLGIALTYLQNNQAQLSEYLNDGRLEISNNLAERSIKPFVIDRKNFLFANTPKGATASAVMLYILSVLLCFPRYHPAFYSSTKPMRLPFYSVIPAAFISSSSKPVLLHQSRIRQ